MLYFYHMLQRTIPILLACASLLLAGFGCKPILDAQRSRQASDEERPSEWMVVLPKWRSEFQTDGTGQVSMEMRSRPDTIVRVNLRATDDDTVVIRRSEQEQKTNEDGWAYFTWQVSKKATFAYSGTISFQNRIVDLFEDEYDAY